MNLQESTQLARMMASDGAELPAVYDALQCLGCDELEAAVRAAECPLCGELVREGSHVVIGENPAGTPRLVHTGHFDDAPAHLRGRERFRVGPGGRLEVIA